MRVHTRAHTHTHTHRAAVQMGTKQGSFPLICKEKLLEWCKSHRFWFIWSVFLCSFYRNINKHREEHFLPKACSLWNKQPASLKETTWTELLPPFSSWSLLQNLVEWDILEVKPRKPPSPVYETNNNKKKSIVSQIDFILFSLRLQFISSANTTVFL